MNEGHKNLINIGDFESVARERLPQMDYDYYAAGALDEITLADNCDAYSRIKLRYRVFTGVADRDLGVEVLGCKATMPIFVAPTAFHRSNNFPTYYLPFYKHSQ